MISFNDLAAQYRSIQGEVREGLGQGPAVTIDGAMNGEISRGAKQFRDR